MCKKEQHLNCCICDKKLCKGDRAFELEDSKVYCSKLCAGKVTHNKHINVSRCSIVLDDFYIKILK